MNKWNEKATYIIMNTTINRKPVSFATDGNQHKIKTLLKILNVYLHINYKLL